MIKDESDWDARTRCVWGCLGHRFDITEPLGFVQDA